MTETKGLNPPENSCAGWPAATGEVCGGVEAQHVQKEALSCSLSLASGFIISSLFRSSETGQPLLALNDTT
jgi:hypothetical protein